MTKDEALQMCLEYIETNAHERKYVRHAIKEALAQPEEEPLTEWLICPKCSYKSPYTPIKAKTLAEDAERITKQARAALAKPRTFDDYGNKIV